MFGPSPAMSRTLLSLNDLTITPGHVARHAQEESWRKKMSASGLPFDDFRELLRNLPGPDSAALAVARERDAQLT